MSPEGSKGWPSANHRDQLISQTGGQRAGPQGNVTWAVRLCGSEGGREKRGEVSGIEEGFAGGLLGLEGKDTMQQ